MFDFFPLNSANLICRGTEVSKYFRESRGLRVMRVDYSLNRMGTVCQSASNLLMHDASSFSQMDLFKLWGCVSMAKQLVLLTSDQKVPGSNQASGRV